MLSFTFKRLYSTVRFFRRFSDENSMKLHRLNEEEIVSLSKKLFALQNRGLDNRLLFEQLDSACTARFREWTYETHVAILKNMHDSGHYRGKFATAIIKKRLRGMTKNLSTCDLIQALGVLSKSNAWFHCYKMYDLEFSVGMRYEDLSVFELSRFLRFFNLRNYSVQWELASKIYATFATNASGCDAYAYAQFFDFVCVQRKKRGELSEGDSAKITSVLRYFAEYGDKSDHTANSIALYACQRLNTYHRGLFEGMKSRIRGERNLKAMDIHRFASAFAYFGDNDEELYADLTGRPFLREYPKKLLRIVALPSMVGVYNDVVCSFIMSSFFLTDTFGKKLNEYTVPVELSRLSRSVKEDKPHYDGNILNAALEEKIVARHAWPGPPPDNCSRQLPVDDRVFGDFCTVFRGMYGRKSLHYAYVFPYIRKCNPLFLVDSDGWPMELPESVSENVNADVRKLPPGRWCCVIFKQSVLNLDKNDDARRDVRLVGYDAMKARHAAKRGLATWFLDKSWLDATSEEKERRIETGIRRYFSGPGRNGNGPPGGEETSGSQGRI